MTVFFNELSIHGQFDPDNPVGFKQSIQSIMQLRGMLKRETSEELKTHSTLSELDVGTNWPFRRAIRDIGLNQDQLRAISIWMDRGPFWDPEREGSEDDYLEVDNLLVTNTALAEAAYRVMMSGLETNNLVLSLAPSN